MGVSARKTTANLQAVFIEPPFIPSIRTTTGLTKKARGGPAVPLRVQRIVLLQRVHKTTGSGAVLDPSMNP
jgi:hypothetical protein